MSVASSKLTLSIAVSVLVSVLLSMGVFAVNLDKFSDSHESGLDNHGAPASAEAAELPYEFPGGGRKLFPAYRLVALYGTPNNPRLGALGEQPLEATLERVKLLAAEHQKHTGQFVLP